MSGRLSIPIGVVVTRSRTHGLWQDDVWRPSTLVLGTPQVKVGNRMWEEADETHFFAGTATLSLHDDEIDDYRANLEQRPPLVYVVLQPRDDTLISQPPAVHLVTAAPSEAESYQEADVTCVGCVAMPRAVATVIAAFIGERVRRHSAKSTERANGR